jgi:hypothetical protein
MKLVHPAAKMVYHLVIFMLYLKIVGWAGWAVKSSRCWSLKLKAQDGTTSVVVLAGSFLEAAQKLLEKGIHPTVISESFQKVS